MWHAWGPTFFSQHSQEKKERIVTAFVTVVAFPSSLGYSESNILVAFMCLYISAILHLQCFVKSHIDCSKNFTFPAQQETEGF